MENPQSLQTIAQIAIAIAGFSGLVVTFRKNDGSLTSIQKYRLRVLLSLAFSTMFLSLLPDLFYSFGLRAPLLWACSCAVAAVFSLVFLAWWLIASRRMMHQVPEIFDWFAIGRMGTGHAIVIVMLLLVVTPVFREHGEGIYVAALMWYILHASQQFARMLFIRPTGE